ncbi:MAG: MBL fold metallo-hydrolase [Planctomycetaceae bacterium]|nr:MBL fold metallo-hydrolase [Planctomycetales bacterium]MCB9927387.1 MBL fold metallo-hydrolase [Planctomycetaceae bacterium]
MFFKRYYLGCLAHASYMIADEETKVAAVVDPQRDIDQYLADAQANGFQLKYVFLTHFHADFVAGHIELRDKAGAKIYLGERAQAEYDFTPVKDGDVVEFGKVRLAVLETPGHTPEGISLLVYDLAQSDRDPHAVLTGDTLFIGDVGRPDLLASIGVTADELADMLYDSLNNKLLSLPDATLVYPAHGAGSMCGKQLSSEAYSTIGEQRKYNYALQPMSRDEFKRLVTADQAEAPDYFVHDAILNRQDRQSLDTALQDSLKPLELGEVVAMQQAGAQVLDVREAIDFAGAHLAGSLNVGLKGKYATWCGTVLDREKPVIVLADEGDEEEAAMRLGRIGLDLVKGYVAGGPGSLEQRPDLIATTERITSQALSEEIAKQAMLVVVDVRAEKEWNDGHIEGSVNIPLSHLSERAAELPSEKTLVVHCKSGYRSSIAASILQQQGFEHVLDLVGGFDAWSASKLPVTGSASSQCTLSQVN